MEDLEGAWQLQGKNQLVWLELTAGPQVNGKGVVRGAKQDLRCPVPSGSNVIGQNGTATFLFSQLCHRASQAKVCQFHQALAVEQQIAWLQAE